LSTAKHRKRKYKRGVGSSLGRAKHATDDSSMNASEEDTV